MLNHSVIGPNAVGRYLVTYPTPGCALPTVVAECTTVGQAEDEARRLNAHQLDQEKSIRQERELRGLGGVYAGVA